MKTIRDVKAGIAKSNKKYDDFMEDFRTKKKEFEASPEHKAKPPRLRYICLFVWMRRYEREHPDYHVKMGEFWKEQGELHTQRLASLE